MPSPAIVCDGAGASCTLPTVDGFIHWSIDRVDGGTHSVCLTNPTDFRGPWNGYPEEEITTILLATSQMACAFCWMTRDFPLGTTKARRPGTLFDDRMQLVLNCFHPFVSSVFLHTEPKTEKPAQRSVCKIEGTACEAQEIYEMKE